MNEHLLLLQPTKTGLRTIQYKCHKKCHKMFDKNTVDNGNKNVG